MREKKPGEVVKAKTVSSPLARASASRPSTIRRPSPDPCHSSETARDLNSATAGVYNCSIPQAITSLFDSIT